MTTHLHRTRWGVRAVLALGVIVSITGNVLHARRDPIAECISAWPPLALLLTIELISRVPVHSRTLAAARVAAAVVVAGIAAWVSYWHLAGVAVRYGEATKAANYLLPLSVDGLVVVVSVCLVELSGRIRTATRTEATTAAAALLPAPATDSPADGAEVPAEVPVPTRRQWATPELAAAIATLRADHPDLTATAVGESLGVSARRVRQAEAWARRVDQAAQAKVLPVRPEAAVAA